MGFHVGTCTNWAPQRRHRARTSCVLATLCALCCSSVTSVALGQGTSAVQRLALHVELGGGTMLTDFQTNRDPQRTFGVVYGYRLGLGGAVRAGISLVDFFSIQASYANYFFPTDINTTGAVFTFTGGARIEPSLARIVRPWIDANIGMGATGSELRLTYDFALGAELLFAHEMIGIGPMGRVAIVHQPENTADGTPELFPQDALFWNAGLQLSLRAPRTPPPPPPPPDQDHDDVIDSEDRCPTEPSGARPDPERRGCPVRDADGDLIADSLDACPTQSAGINPDLRRVGCPRIDTDRDGVFDLEDQCPNVAPGETPDNNRPGCPDGDDDNDTVRNGLDLCPARHQGPHADPARMGCPAPDRDGDSVADPVDHCPDQPGAPHTDPNRNGCPGLVRIERGQLRIMTPVFFATRRDVILPRSFTVLQAVTDALQATPEIRLVSIEGHTDDVGDDAANMGLSERRAHNVMSFLITHGVAPARLEAHGFGETRPLVPQTTASARAANRRVEFRIVQQDGQAPASATASTTVTTPLINPE